MPEYHELAPPPHLTDAVECIWFLSQTGNFAYSHRVTPDGCADILFTRHADRASLQAVGPMTAYQDFTMAPRVFTAGIRFRPGMWTKQFAAPAQNLTNTLLPLEDIWGSKARKLLAQLTDAKSPKACASLFAAFVPSGMPRTPLQQAIAWMEREKGLISLADLARQCGLSTRQLRRVFLAETGLSPKFLARVLRFRHALSKVAAQKGQHAGLAVDCGYTDQSHFIAEFRELAGRTPGAFLNSAA